MKTLKETEKKLPYLTNNACVVRKVNSANLEIGQMVEYSDLGKNWKITDIHTYTWGVDYTIRYVKSSGELGRTKKVPAYNI